MYYQNALTKIHAAITLTDSSLRNANSRVLVTCRASVGFADSFQEGGQSEGELEITFIRLLRAAIIEFEYIFARISTPV